MQNDECRKCIHHSAFLNLFFSCSITPVNIRKLFCRCLVMGIGFCAVAGLADRALALEPNEIALVVNANVPEGMELAKFYTEQRHIPENRILVLDLPKTDQMTTKQYEDEVVPQVRDFLHTGQLENRVKCLVTFYGVPLRIDPRVNTAEDAAELQSIQQQLQAAPDQIRPAVEAIEAMAKQLNPDFTPETFGDLDHLLKRKNAAFHEVSTQVADIPDKARQAELLGQFLAHADSLLGDKARIDKLTLALATPGDKPRPDDQKDHDNAVQQYNDMVSQASPLEKLPNDPQARRKLREIAKAHFGSIQYVSLLRDQADYLDTTQSGAAFDSELAMVEWNVYTHKAFCPNPLFYGNRSPGMWPTLMVSRLDAPTPAIVKSMITTSIQVEQEGLNGKVVIDSLGVLPGKESPDKKGYGQYDQYLRDLNKLLTERTKLSVSIDERPELLASNSYDNVALYVGWYSVHNYVPCCKFSRGAVGYHIASYELVEVYWKTCPAVSWMMACVGDPLYTPYRKDPAMGEADLPFRLRQALAGHQ
jgi:hypothetical protein